MAARVIVFGYGPLAIVALETLESIGVAPAAVVVPSNRRGPDVEAVDARARNRGWSLLVQPSRRTVEPFVRTLQELSPDLLLVWSYSMLLPPRVIGVANHGAVNVHGGLLPEYRGGHVMNWAIANGERETGITLAYLDDGIDTGPVIAEQRFPIDPEDDAASVRDKLKTAGQALLTAWWPTLAAGRAQATPQDESRARYYRMRTPDDGRIDWTASNGIIRNLVRALVAPWPGAFCEAAKTRLVVRLVRPVETGPEGGAPGAVTRFDDRSLYVATGSGEIELVAVEIDGRPAGPADLRQAGVAVGMRLIGTT